MSSTIKLVLLLLVGVSHFSTSSATFHLLVSGRHFRGGRAELGFGRHSFYTNAARQQILAAQNCPVVQANEPVPDELIRTLQARQLETIRQVHQATQSIANRLVHQDPTFEPLALSLISGLRFGAHQRGYGSLNHGRTIPESAIEVTKFSCELLTLTKKWAELEDEMEVANKNLNMFQQFREQAAFGRRLNELTDATLVRWHRERIPLYSLAAHLLHGTRFQGVTRHFHGTNKLGYGIFNYGQSVDETVLDLTEFTRSLAAMVDQWEAALAEQNKLCFVVPTVEVPVQKVPESSVVVVSTSNNNKNATVAPQNVSSTPAPQQVEVTTTIAKDLIDQVDPRAMPDTETVTNSVKA